ncbi:MAG: NAD-dependent epimerase/dehydratase family protein [Armatimonadetes bacterium]|nr:NAD-dependent epimerase/dehydratase family protein [Armatimonadota bacterium]
MDTLEQLEEILSRPTPGLVRDLGRLEGDVLILGTGGKIGPTLARMARRALDECGGKREVIGVDLFPQPGPREALEKLGIRTLACDLLKRDQVAALPDVPNVVFMAGTKFGSTGAEDFTWAMNAYMPGLVAERFQGSRIVVFSTGCVYPLVPVISGGATEETPPDPVGEYAQSTLGRERVFEFFSRRSNSPLTLFRLNYAVELRYGVLLDVGEKVWKGQPVDVTMGHANVLWQGDVAARALQCLNVAQSPPTVLNVTGPEVLSIRQVARRYGQLMGREPVITGQEADTALLVNPAKANGLFGYPTVAADTVMQWIAHWLEIEGPTLNKPTHYETRDGKF